MFIIKYKKYFLSLAIILVIVAVIIVFVKGFNVGIEFTGGTILEVSYGENRPEIDLVKESVASLGIDAQIQEFGDSNVVIKTAALDEDGVAQILDSIKIDDVSPEIVRLNSVGPSLGEELQNKAYIAIGIVVLAIILFIALAFRKISKPVSSWKYGLVAVIALIHDIAIPAGIWALFGLEVNSLFIVGLLSILGLSVNDTIVVFDRIRENLKENDENTIHENFDETVGRSITQTMARSIFTSLTLVVVLAALLIWGPASTQGLSLVLLLGAFFGTYSSIFVAAPLLSAFTKK